MTLAQQPDVGRRDRCGERAAGFEIGDQHGFFRVQELAVSAMKWTPASTITSASVARRFACQREAVADDVGDRVEDVRGLIVVRQDDGICAPA